MKWLSVSIFSPQPEKEIIVPESSSDMEEEDGVDKLLMNADEKQQYADRVKRSYRRKTQSPKRHIHPEMPILDERYAASLLEYYSKHKPYYPGEMDGTRHVELEVATSRSDTAMEEKSLGSSQELVSGRSSVSGQYNGPEGEGATEDEVAAIVQSVVSAHMDEVLAARQYKQQLHGENSFTSWIVKFGHLNKWATSWQNQQNDCAQRRLRSAWASAQSDQSLCCVL